MDGRRVDGFNAGGGGVSVGDAVVVAILNRYMIQVSIKVLVPGN